MIGTLQRKLEEMQFTSSRKKISTRQPRNPLSAERLEQRLLLTISGPIISEFMASNSGFLIDQFGLSSDWVEIYNPTAEPVSLSGWHLTDDPEAPDKWTFPDMTVDGGDFVVVFASGEDVVEGSQPLHTNFRLGADGEYLALVQPDMTIAHEFAETFPKQFSDVSYGLSATSFPAFDADDTFTYHSPGFTDFREFNLDSSWAGLDYDDSSWKVSDNVSLSQGVGYANSTSSTRDFAGQFATDVESDMYQLNASLLIRHEFNVDDPTAFDTLELALQYDDGFVAFLNGEPVVEVNVPAEGLVWNAEAEIPRAARRRNDDALRPEFFDLSPQLDLLVPGTNVLGIHALNDRANDRELLIRGKLTGYTMGTELNNETVSYLSTPTPEGVNRATLGGAVELSVESQTFREPFTVELTPVIEGQTIRYTTDGSEPTIDSTVYTDPIDVTTSMRVKATTFSSDGTPGPVSTGAYVRISDDALSFSSELPVVVFNSNVSNFNEIQKSVDTESFVSVFEPGENGRTSFETESALESKAIVERRGSSTAGNPKLNMSVEFQNNSGSDQDVPLLGMPAESDWVFYGTYNFDRSKGIRNSFFYEIANQIGRYAPRTRIVEVFHNMDGEELTEDDYQGIYVIIEKIKRGEDRVDVEKIGPDDITEPDVTGGYIWKIDRVDAPEEGETADSGFRAGGVTILWVNPKEPEAEAVPEQVEWATNYFDNMLDVIENPDSSWEQVTEIIDVESWVDHAIVNTVTFNLDAYRLSGYFYKDRGGKLEMGPIWDCDRCMDSEDGRDNDPEIWHSNVSDFGTDFFNYPWWVHLYANQPDFWQAWIDRWFQFRDDALSDENMTAIVDTFASQIEDAHERDTDKWPQNTPNGGPYDPNSTNTWESEVIHLRNWILARAQWMDERFVDRVEITPDGGQLTPGQQVTMSAPAGTIYYTTDGSDPRASGGGVAAGAMAYTGPITVDPTATIMARAFDDSLPVVMDGSRNTFTNPNRLDDVRGPNDPKVGSFWSAPVSVSFSSDNIADASNLRIAELNYHPTEATAEELQTLGDDAVQNGVSKEEFEFIELVNISDEPIELGGAQLVRVHAFDTDQGVDFTFADQTLAPGERAVIVEDVDAFGARYGDAPRILSGNRGDDDGTDGQYGGQLENRGETIKLQDRFGRTIQRFTYGDSGAWPERADGRGSSLVLSDATSDFGDPENWRASSEVGGSPGTVGADPADASLVLTEVLTNTQQPEGDLIELYNPTGQPVDISNWFISNSPTDFGQYQIAAGTVVPAGGYVVFNEQTTGIEFDGLRDGEITVVAADANGNPTQFVLTTSFGFAPPEVSLGRWPDNTGTFQPMATTTFGGDNSEIWTPDVVITEIHYEPIDPDGRSSRERSKDYEFIELFNQSASPVDLQGWRLTGDNVDFSFDQSTTIDPGQTILLTTFDPTDTTQVFAFRFLLDAPDDVPLLGPYTTSTRSRVHLPDDGGTLRLEMPVSPADTVPIVYYAAEHLTYETAAPWPTGLNATGMSLTRTEPTAPAFLASSWVGRDNSPGTTDFFVRQVGDSNGDGVFDQNDIVAILQADKYLTGQPASFEEGDWNNDGLFNQLDIVAALVEGNYLGGAQAAISPIGQMAKGGNTEREELSAEAVDTVFRLI